MRNLYKVYYRYTKDADSVPDNNIDIIAPHEATARDRFKAIYDRSYTVGNQLGIFITGVSLIRREVT
jgi:hypothetical protein